MSVISTRTLISRSIMVACSSVCVERRFAPGHFSIGADHGHQKRRRDQYRVNPPNDACHCAGTDPHETSPSVQYLSGTKRRPSSVAWSSYSPLVDRLGSLTLSRATSL